MSEVPGWSSERYEDEIERLTQRLVEAEDTIAGRTSECVHCHDTIQEPSDRGHWETCKQHPAHARLAEFEARCNQFADASSMVSQQLVEWLEPPCELGKCHADLVREAILEIERLTQRAEQAEALLRVACKSTRISTAAGNGSQVFYLAITADWYKRANEVVE